MKRETTIHHPVDREQLGEIDRYMADHEIATRPELIDEALGEMFARRSGYRYHRTYGKTTGLKGNGLKRRSTDK